MAEIKKFNAIFDYLSAPVPPSEANGNFVFGRADQRLAERMADMYRNELAEYFLVTGGVGKDSGDLKVPEAVFVAQHAEEAGIPKSMLHLETEATNGGENARFGLAVIEEKQLALEALTVVAHATSLLRLSELLKHEADNSGRIIKEMYRVPTGYPFNPNNPADQQEATAELLRLADWPGKGWLPEQPDLQRDDLANLVDFARHQTGRKSQ